MYAIEMEGNYSCEIHLRESRLTETCWKIVFLFVCFLFYIINKALSRYQSYLPLTFCVFKFSIK